MFSCLENVLNSFAMSIKKHFERIVERAKWSPNFISVPCIVIMQIIMKGDTIAKIVGSYIFSYLVHKSE